MCGRLNARDTDREVTIMGWVARVRDLGPLIFVQLRDISGEVQVVFDADRAADLQEAAKGWRTEYVVAIKGVVADREPEAVNPDSPTGSIEIYPSEARLLNPSETPPFYIRDGIGVEDRLRLSYRYLDLRRPEMRENLILRDRANRLVRSYLGERGFLEVETPYLTKSTPEGARDYLVPTRGRRGEFFALPQSPQLFKQLLMISGLDRYYQLVRCFRDEDLRADRQPEFTQIDVEMSFVGEEEVQRLTEGLLAHLFSEFWEVEVNVPFAKMSYREAMDRFGSDKPDTRYGLELREVSAAVEDSSFRVFSSTLESGGAVKGIRVPGGIRFSRNQLDSWEARVKEWGGAGLLWFVWEQSPLGGLEAVRSPVAKFLSEAEVRGMARIADIEEGDLLLLMAGERSEIDPILGNLRSSLASELDLVEDGRRLEFLWIVDPPLFESDAETGGLTSIHHPFTSPRPEDADLLEKDPLRARARAYDVVLNGVELGGGSIRIHRPEMQSRVLAALGFDERSAREQFGFLLDAFRYGAPPHGGIALGMDRLLMMLARRDSIRDMIPFPKSATGRDLMTGAPSPVSEEQLAELGLKWRDGDDA
ncbi:MAG: aspartate--tRNA ligase [Clostridia bacterium]